MRIAITGGTGLLGRSFVKYLILRGHTPIVISRRDMNTFTDVEFRITDYSVSSLKDSLFDVEAVVHLAAQRGNSNELTDYQINTEITQNLYEACRLNNIYNIVYASTISVYSDDSLLPWHEEILPEPVSVYGISKLNGEHLGDIYNKQYGLKVKKLRFAHLFGCNEENNYMINKFMRLAYKKAPLELFSERSPRREFLYVKDAAHALFLAVMKKDLHVTCNIGSGEALTNKMVAESINHAFSNKGNIIHKNCYSPLTKSSLMNSDKAFRLLGFNSEYSFVEAMKDIYKEMCDV